MKPVQLLILAGGIGKRMRPLSFCKSLIPFAGKPIIKYVLEDWQKIGITDFKIVSNPENIKKLKAVLGEKNKKFFVQKKPLGMAEAVLNVKLEKNKPLIIVNGEDLIAEEGCQDFLKMAEKTKGEVLLTGLYREEYFPGGYFKIKDRQVLGIIEKPEKDRRPSKFINLVVHYFRRPFLFLKYLKEVKTNKDDAYEMALDRMIKDKIKVELFTYQGYWQSLKYPWHILEMMALIFKHRWQRKVAKNAKISSHAIIKGQVIIEDEAEVYDGACLVGPVYLGKKSIVGHHTLIRESMIGDNCVIGFGTEIARSWVGHRCWFHTNYIGDSVLEENVSFGAGTVTANLRLDGREIFVKRDNQQKVATGKNKLGSLIAKDVKIGVNVSLMPGIIIGSHNLVYPHAVLYDNLKER